MSSAGYADRLKPYDNKGVCGLPESCDSRRVLDKKIGTLVDLVRGSKHTVILTGAGVSTSAGIPDFRGPNGVWTRQMKEEEEEKAKAKAVKEKAVKGAAHRPAKRTKKDSKRRGAAGAEEGAGEGGGGEREFHRRCRSGPGRRPHRQEVRGRPPHPDPQGHHAPDLPRLRQLRGHPERGRHAPQVGPASGAPLRPARLRLHREVRGLRHGVLP